MSIVADRSATKIPSGTWSIDPVWSALEFEVKKIGLINVKGRVPGFTGTIQGGEHPSIEGAVDVSSITTFDETRDTHLQSSDFFDVARHPELRFESTSVEVDGDELVVEGDLTIRGITKRVELRGSFLGTPPIRWGTTGSHSSSPARSIARTSGSTGTHRSRAAASS